MDWKNITKEELKSLIDSRTYMSIGDMFGISDAAVKKKAKKFGIWVRKKQYNGHNHSHPNKLCRFCGKEVEGNNKFCDSSCLVMYNDYIYLNKWKLGLDNGLRGQCSINLRIRKYLFEKYNNKCSRCGWSEINPISKKIPLQVEHIDGDYTNNKEDNLILLCPNCHSLTPTYGYLNAGNGRLYKRIKHHKDKNLYPS